jgi:hypothetical protein
LVLRVGESGVSIDVGGVLGMALEAPSRERDLRRDAGRFELWPCRYLDRRIHQCVLNRGRDDQLRDEDRVALASTLYAELTGIHRSFIENAEHLTDKPPSSDGGFVVPEPSIKLLPEMLSKLGLLRADTIRTVMDAYVLTEQYLEQLILAGGTLQSNMPENRQIVYLDAQPAEFVIEFNRTRAGVVKEAVNALAPYLK